ncbi:PREDICTED: histone H3.v1-like isoform X2 [Nelumbo nucifera]|uniref:Histone H3.v1-like isoform X2 n=1 Tax=Nelumbo nucifera TaxID=4432 RepID=A0A1U7ZLR5_NELNU|nr:PREDICTED: histone H3.v1-like isoform X2 [Nelumbo nucifera]
MAVSGGEEEEAEYESDPEESMPLAMRRREASDDEEGEGEDREKPRRVDRRVVVDSDGESDGQGGAPAYDDEESEIEEEMEEEEDEEEVEEVEEEEEEYEERHSEEGHGAGEVEGPEAVPDSGVEGRRSGGEPSGFRGKNQPEEEKKENEPFAVPTAGAFYMHDDRFRDNGGGRHRRTPGGRKLWESKDDRKWGHDKFEEMTLQETHYEEERRRTSKGYYRGRGKNRGMDRGYTRGNRSRAYENNNNHNRTAKSVRGRGPRRYEPTAKNGTETPPTQNKQSVKSSEPPSTTSSGKVSTQALNVQTDPAPPRKNAFASSLNSASPPFYPSGSSNQDISVTQKRDPQSGKVNRNLTPSVLMEENFSMPHSSAMLRGKTISDPIGQDQPYIDEPMRSVSGKLTNLQINSSGPSPVNSTQPPQSRGQGRGLTVSGQLNYQPAPSFNQVNRVSPQPQISSIQPRPVQIPVQPSLRASTQHLGQHPGSGSQASSPPKAPSRNSPEPGETESPPGSSKAKTALVGKGKGSVQGSGRGSFLYSGAQVIGATGTVGVAHGDQSFPATPALLPVMQFGGQHPGGLGVPAVGMALPGYVAQPQLGFGNSEMTWVPVLAGAAGALGATYCSPYIAVDGGYYARPSGQTSSLSGSGETNTSKANNAWKPPQRPELVNDEFGQRQNKPRRYSEMNFGQ